MDRGGLTLMELIAAIAIVVVVAAIALPAVENRLASVRFESAGRDIEAAILMARAESQRRGVPLSLTARPVGHGETGLFVEALPGSAEGEAAADGGQRAAGRAAPDVVVGAGVQVTAEAPGTPGATDVGRARLAVESDGDVRASASGARSAAEVVIARFMPDGSAVAAGPVYLVGRSSSSAIVVNTWTGTATFRPVDRTAGDGRQGAESAEAPPAEAAPTGGTGGAP